MSAAVTGSAVSAAAIAWNTIKDWAGKIKTWAEGVIDKIKTFIKGDTFTKKVAPALTAFAAFGTSVAYCMDFWGFANSLRSFFGAITSPARKKLPTP